MNVRKPDLKASARATHAEIQSQPAVWHAFAQELARRSTDVRAWIAQNAPEEIWLCGAGTSAYIGDTVCVYLDSLSPIRHRSIPTTSLVACPQDFVGTRRRVLVVSFGRSGNSSETIGTLDILDRHMPHAARLNITCNGESKLARHSVPDDGRQMTIVLPDGAHDQGFAMTASFTTMLLTVLACLDPVPPSLVKASITALVRSAEKALAAADDLARMRLAVTPERAVFLGSGALTGVARESALKVLELTCGEVATHWESSLGFRHGPKAIMNDRTLVFANISADPHTQQYDLDLVAELRRQFGKAAIVTVGPSGTGCDLELEPVGNDAWSAVLYVLLPQLVAALWGESLGVNVDNPFSNGELNRVVSGVTLYDYSNG